MRKQEKKWGKHKKETRDEYRQRLRRTAMNLPAEYINKIMGAMTHRIKLLGAAKGGHFREGGKHN